MQTRRSHRDDRFGSGAGSVLASWLLFLGLLGLVVVGSTLDLRSMGTVLLAGANAAAGLWLGARLRRE